MPKTIQYLLPAAATAALAFGPRLQTETPEVSTALSDKEIADLFRNRDMGFGAPNRTVPQPEFYDGGFSRLLGPATGQLDPLGRAVPRGAIFDPATFRMWENRRWIGGMTFIAEKCRLQIRFDWFNGLNRHTLGGIITGVVNPLFGQVTQVSGNRGARVGTRLDF